MEEEVEANETIPDILHAKSFIAARLKELTTLSKAIGEGNRVASIFQRLPKHMRRRAMSHTVKRVPRNLRDAHKRQLEKNRALKKAKRPRKRYRKRAKKLLLEYNRRQRTKTWLETHIWHAKRFRMGVKWNYKVPLSSYEKTFRACYRATKSHCLVQDISYYCCIELCGPFDILVREFESITSSHCGLSIRAKCWSNGNREGSISLFHAHKYPYGAIGKINFMWKPETSDSNIRTLWLWCHPSFHNEVVEELIQVFGFEDNSNDESEGGEVFSETNLRKTSHVELIKLKMKNVPSQKIPVFKNHSKNIVMKLLKDTLNRFRLTGSLSNAVLTEALHSAQTFRTVVLGSIGDQNWWMKKYAEEEDEIASLQLLKDYSLPSCFPCNVILGCNVVDPRLFLKKIRTKAVPEREGIFFSFLPTHFNLSYYCNWKLADSEYCLSIPPSFSDSALWDQGIRDEVSIGKFSSAQLNVLRSQQFVPGFDEQLLKAVNTVIPIILIQRPGTSNPANKFNYSSGWDIISPTNWGMPVWLSLILCGARSGGLRENESITFESQNVPEIAPDTRAGIKYFSEITSLEKNMYFKKPPNKRTNYMKIGIPTPFHYPWKLLTEEWRAVPVQASVEPSQSEDSFYVLRDRNELRKLKEYVNITNFAKSFHHYMLPLEHLNSLVPVAVTMLCKGNLVSFSHICLPTESDFNIRLRNKYYNGPIEKKHLDLNKPERILLKNQHIKELKRLRRKRLQEKKERMKKGPPIKIMKLKESPTLAIVEHFKEQMRELWVPSKVTRIRNYCDREICGFIVAGGFSFMQSRIIGQGYIVAEALMKLLELRNKLKCDSTILIRSPNSLNYKFCKISIIDH